MSSFKRARRRVVTTLAVCATISLLGAAAPSSASAEPSPPQPVIVSALSAQYEETGQWQSARDPGYGGAVTRYVRGSGPTASWTLTAPADGWYSLAVWYAASSDNATVRYTVPGMASEPVEVNQAQGGNSWNRITQAKLVAGQTVTVTLHSIDDSPAPTNPDLARITRADSVRLAPASQPCGVVSPEATQEPSSTQKFDAFTVQRSGTTVDIETSQWSMSIDRQAFRYFVKTKGESPTSPHPVSGLQMATGDGDLCDAAAAEVTSLTSQGIDLLVTFTDGHTAQVTIRPTKNDAGIQVTPTSGEATSIRARMAGGLNPALGLGDFGGFRPSLNVYGAKTDAYYAQAAGGTTNWRFISNFTVFPAHRLAQVAFSRANLPLQVDDDATMLGVDGDTLDLHYFFGSMPDVYAAYAAARHDAGFADAAPRPTFFGVGYESYGALGYNTNQQTITNSVSTYLQKGYPISWAVTGSGFWKYRDDDPNATVQGTTSSFGIWGHKYPDPDGYKKFFANNNIALILGLRQSFKALPADDGNYDAALDGPWTVEGLNNGYFIKDETGKARVFSPISFPKSKIYLLDPDNPEAVAWFVKNSEAWGADGYKEDHMFDATANNLIDNGLVNPINAALEKGSEMMVRNSAFSVAGSTLRINDTDYNQGASDQDRTLINSLADAASGQPNAYPDIVGGRIIPDLETNDAKQIFLTRNAMADAMLPSMSFGNEPWRMDNRDLVDATVKAARWHDLYTPYIYSAAIDSFHTGYPTTVTPLPIAYPDDAATYDIASKANQQYEWMLGQSLLAAPIYGSDIWGQNLDTAPMSRDVYLPAGTWEDFETGEIFTGPTTLANYAVGYDKVPAFVGGTGILVRRAEVGSDTLVAEVYPVARQGAAMTHTAFDGSSTSTITRTATSLDAAHIEVVDDAGGKVAFSTDPVTSAVSFAITPGTSYTVRDAAAPSPDPTTTPTATPTTPAPPATPADSGTTEPGSVPAAPASNTPTGQMPVTGPAGLPQLIAAGAVLLAIGAATMVAATRRRRTRRAER